MAFFDKLNGFAKNIGDKATAAIEIARLNNRITAETNAANEELKKIGEFYYGKFAAGESVAQETSEFCQAAASHYAAASDAQAAIERIKSENETFVAADETVVAAQDSVCPACGFQNVPGTKFCGDCGAMLPEIGTVDRNTCQSCGAKLPENVKFCPSCGAQL